ncbi:hypothetical protein [Sphingomicrobium arenosum]|uniref:hypothetical protein n=1 Tax=Sphingomicrobium arenosum TaxID=2233861 RepID=UPI002240F820|nr:hypothetical protein [Sphingomicrobium arenosum]
MRYCPWSIAAFFAFVLLGGAARWAIGSVYSSGEAIQLMDTLASSGLYLGSAAATASATILALMLTLTGMIKRLDRDWDAPVWKTIDRVSQFSTISLLASLTLLLALVFPIGEFDKLPAGWFATLYNLLFGWTVLVIALLATTVTMLYRTIRTVIASITPHEDV